MNAGAGLKRLDEKRKHYKILQAYLQNLGSKKPYIFGGDINVAHTEKDLARPATNKKTPGFTLEEREDFTTLLRECKLVDTYRALNPNTFDKYTYYSFKFECRKKNIGTCF
jgi:exodeoxyribonuclease III